MYNINDKSQPIKDIQLALFTLGYGETHLVPIDGIYGENTRSAVFDFQQDSGLPATGYVDFETHLALMSKMLDNSENEGKTFTLRLGESSTKVEELHVYLNAIFESEETNPFRLEGKQFNQNTLRYVNLFLMRIGDEQNGELSNKQFQRLRMESEIISKTRQTND